jgi:hypothetical protein
MNKLNAEPQKPKDKKKEEEVVEGSTKKLEDPVTAADLTESTKLASPEDLLQLSAA